MAVNMALVIKDLVVKRGGERVVDEVSLEVKEGEVVGLMGANGSGKSSLALAVMGWMGCEVEQGRISIDGEDLLGIQMDERAKKGLFLALQQPKEVEGVTVGGLLRAAMAERGSGELLGEIKRRCKREAGRLGMADELLERGVNMDFSGGERKLMEVLQLKMLEPKYAFLDEVDSGLDGDGLKKVARVVKEEVERGMGVVVISHHRQIFEYLEPSKVVVMKDGKIVKRGKAEVVDEL